MMHTYSAASWDSVVFHPGYFASSGESTVAWKERNASQKLFPKLSFTIFPLPTLQALSAENPAGQKQNTMGWCIH